MCAIQTLSPEMLDSPEKGFTGTQECAGSQCGEWATTHTCHSSPELEWCIHSLAGDNTDPRAGGLTTLGLAGAHKCAPGVHLLLSPGSAVSRAARGAAGIRAASGWTPVFGARVWETYGQRYVAIDDTWATERPPTPRPPRCREMLMGA